MPEQVQRITDELSSLDQLVKSLETGTIILREGVDVTAEELQRIKQIVAYLDAALRRLLYPLN